MREETQLRIIKEVLETFSKKEPFGKHLKRFFYRNRQLGSRDRRVIQQFAYNYFRIGNALDDETFEMKLSVANYLCNQEETPMLKFLLEKYSKLDISVVTQTLEEKLSIVHHQSSNFHFQSIFPFQSELSEQIEAEPFIRSFLVQPKLWIRIRGNYLKLVEDELNEKKIEFGKISDDTHCLYLKNSTSLDNLESFKKGYFEVQDRSSQQTIKSIHPKLNEYWWDACSGAGGKSLAMFEQEPSLNIYATDVRESVLENLKERFLKARIKNYRAEKIDVANLPGNFILPEQFTNYDVRITNEDRKSEIVNRKSFLDGILADVPCSGSGTWARTPEWLQMFDASSIHEFQSLQRRIVTNLVRYLPKNKPLIYITCSVFKKENEENVKYFTENLHLISETNTYISGFMNGADTLYISRMKRKEESD